MQFIIILLLLGSRVFLTRGRPTRLEEENDSETAEVEYEGNDDDSPADDYLLEEQEPVIEEASQQSGRPENDQQESQEQGDASDFEVVSDQQSDQDKYGYDSLSDNNSGSQKEREHNRITDINTESEKDNLSEKARLRKSQKMDEAGNVASDFFPRSHLNRPQNDFSVNGRSGNTDPEYGEMLFKMKTAQTNRQQNNIAEEADLQPRILQHYNNNIHSKTRDQDSENDLNNERDRRHAENIDVKQNSESTRTPNEKEDLSESSENAIIRNIKKLSEHDLEELLNSLPDDKKELLKKIMDKREITKKAGAVDESSYLEGGLPDTSKLEGGFSVDSNTESSIITDTPETSKQPENSDNFSSKLPENENGSGGTASKSEVTSNTDMKNEETAVRKESESSITNAKNSVNIHSDDEEFSKNENKRETNNKDLANENTSVDIEDSKTSDYQFESKDSNDFSVDQKDLCSENEDWIESRLNEPEISNTRSETNKREILQKEPLLQDCVKSLEESFPTANSYEYNNLESDMVPLKRVKRTEKDHHIRKRDSALLSNGKVHFSPGVEDEDCENEENSEYKDYGSFGRASNFVRYDQVVKSSKESGSDKGNKQRRSQFEKMHSELHPAIFSEPQEEDKRESLGSDTDSVLSGIEGVDENLMYSSGSRGKRTQESLDMNADKINLNRIGRTVGPMNDAVSSNSINISQYQDDEAFGTLPRNPEEDVSRFKRVRQVKQK